MLTGSRADGVPELEPDEQAMWAGLNSLCRPGRGRENKEDVDGEK